MVTRTIYRAYQVNGNEYEDFNSKYVAESIAKYYTKSKNQVWDVKEICEKLEFVSRITEETWKKAVEEFVKHEGYCEVEQGDLLLHLSGNVDYVAIGEYDYETNYQESESTLFLNMEECYVLVDDEEKVENIPFYVLEQKLKDSYDYVTEA